MNYLNDDFTTFLVKYSDIDAYAWFRNTLGFIKNILICVPKMNEGLGMTWGWVIN